MPTAFPWEFRDDAVALTQRWQPRVTIKQIEEDLGISETCAQNCLLKAEIEAGRPHRGKHGSGIRKVARLA